MTPSVLHIRLLCCCLLLLTGLPFDTADAGGCAIDAIQILESVPHSAKSPEDALQLASNTTYAASADTRTVPADAFRIAPNDVINVAIFAGGDLQHQVDLTVSDQGMINVPFIGPVQAAGRTTSELEHEIHAPLERDYFVDPQVHVTMKRAYTRYKYSISGAVRSPGLYEMRLPLTIMELVAKAGGTEPDRGNVAYILRGYTGPIAGQNGAEEQIQDEIAKHKPITVDLIRLLNEGDLSRNIQLETGDLVYIPRESTQDQSTTKVYVEGEVKQPGVIDYQPGITALNACIMAGGFTKYAAPNRTKIIRMEKSGQKVIQINLEKVASGDLTDLPLQPGDRLHIPESWL